MSLSKKIVNTYAKSLFITVRNCQPKEEIRVVYDLSEINVPRELNFIPDIYVVAQELGLLRSVIVSSEMMTEYFNNPTYSDLLKLDILITIFPGLTSPVRAFLKILAEKSLLSFLPEICAEYLQILLDFRGTKNVKLVVASILDENYGLLLLKTLKKVTNSTTVLLQVFHSPKILGGLIIEYKSRLIDLSLLKELSLLFS